MFNFTYYNPVRIVFGKGQVGALPKLLPKGARVMVVYGGGSIKKNGVYDRVLQGLEGLYHVEFSGIEQNPEFETCMKAVELARAEKIDFLLAVGGGSVMDATKCIAAAVPFQGDPWDILAGRGKVESALPLGTVVTMPATGSEMNSIAVISRRAMHAKLSMHSPKIFPNFSILDPECTYSLPPKQTANGVVDSFIHTTEQYITYAENAVLQDRQAEALLLTLIEAGPQVMANPNDYNARANVMWAATNALNGAIGCGVPQDWVTHSVGHELTAFFGLEHARSLAVVLPGLWKHQKARKLAKLAQYGRRVWKLEGIDDAVADQAIAKTVAFFEEMGLPTKLAAYNISKDHLPQVIESLRKKNFVRGEHKDITADTVEEILLLCL